MRPNFPLPLFSLGLLAALILAGCASAPSGTIAGLKVPADSTVALFCTPVYPLDGIDVEGHFLDFLRGCGLKPTNKADANFVVQIGFPPDSSPVVCTLVLLQGGKPVISVTGTSAPPKGADADGLSDRDRQAIDRVSAFQDAARKFEARARGAS